MRSKTVSYDTIKKIPLAATSTCAAAETDDSSPRSESPMAGPALHTDVQLPSKGHISSDGPTVIAGTVCVNAEGQAEGQSRCRFNMELGACRGQVSLPGSLG